MTTTNEREAAIGRVVPLRVLIVPDKFKGSLTARQAAEAIADGWAEVRPDDRLELLPMADGGDGFGAVMGDLLGAQRRLCRTVDAAGRPRAAEWWYEQERSTAIIEAAQVNGLGLLPSGCFHPFALDTFGLGTLLRRVAESGASRIYLGLGGSATNDGGFGLARALGWHFRDRTGTEILRWIDLDRLATVVPPTDALVLPELIIAVDVQNPLLGARGASRIFGPQKGLRSEEIAEAEACLKHLAEVMRDMLGEDHALLPGAGAAGGLGFGLKAFCGGTFRSGGEIFMEVAGLPKRLATHDLVITAEGRFDGQSLMGKGVGLVAAEATRVGRPCLCLAGSLEKGAAETAWPDFQALAIVPEVTPLAEAMARPEECLRRLAAHAARTCRLPSVSVI